MALGYSCVTRIKYLLLMSSVIQSITIYPLKSKGILDAGDKIILAGGHSYVNGVKSSKMIGGYVEI